MMDDSSWTDSEICKRREIIPDRDEMGNMNTKQTRADENRRIDHLIPKDRAAWLDFLMTLVKRKIHIEHLNDEALEKVIERARPQLAKRKPYISSDPDAPICLAWNPLETANWIERMGFPYLKEAFLVNRISGRKLILMDANALIRMGMSDLGEIRKATSKIRRLLQLSPPNFMRSLMRASPWERFLLKKAPTTDAANALTFEHFCKQEGYKYSLWKYNKNAQIPLTCELRVLPTGIMDEEGEEIEEDVDDASLRNAPSVEYIVRTLEVRDRAVTRIIQKILENVFLPNEERKWGNVKQSLKCEFDQAFEELNEECKKERLAFVTEVAKGLLDELEATANIFADIEELQAYIGEKVDPEYVEFLRSCALEFMENVVPIAAYLAFGDLDLETIFKEEPEFNQLVDEVCDEAESKIKGMGKPGFSQLNINKKLTKVQSIQKLLEDPNYRIQ